MTHIIDPYPKKATTFCGLVVDESLTTVPLREAYQTNFQGTLCKGCSDILIRREREEFYEFQKEVKRMCQ